jgi:hypothetical protein
MSFQPTASSAIIPQFNLKKISSPSPTLGPLEIPTVNSYPTLSEIPLGLKLSKREVKVLDEEMMLLTSLRGLSDSFTDANDFT